MNLFRIGGISFVLITLSALCSGLNLALMSLDVSELRRKSRLGNKAAKRILPLRRNGHLSLASILLTNVAVVSALSLVLEHEFNGLIAGIASTILIVIFGEVLPQAYFAQRALGITARLAPFLKFMIIFTYPISKPLQLLLDKLFPARASSLHSRQELGLLISEHTDHSQSELDESEVEIIRGALKLSEKRVSEIMVPMSDVYYLKLTDTINRRKIDEIKLHNWSRIPVFNKQLTECYGLLLMKELVDIDFDSQTYKVSDLALRRTQPVGHKTALDTIFRRFIAARTHLMPVTRGKKMVGIVSIEDVFEEIIGQEIEDETDGIALKRHGSDGNS